MPWRCQLGSYVLQNYASGLQKHLPRLNPVGPAVESGGPRAILESDTRKRLLALEGLLAPAGTAEQQPSDGSAPECTSPSGADAAASNGNGSSNASNSGGDAEGTGGKADGDQRTLEELTEAAQWQLQRAYKELSRARRVQVPPCLCSLGAPSM